MYATVFNPTRSPVPISDAGHSLGGGEWDTAQTTDEVVKAALSDGRLVVVDAEFGEDAQAGAREAATRTAEYRQRDDALRNLDRDKLHQLAAKHGLVDAGGDAPLKDQLVSMLVRSDVALPESRAAQRTGKKE